MPFDAADRAAFLDSTMPGYYQATIDGLLVDGLFRRPYAESFGLMSGENPSFRALSETLAAVSPGDAVDVAGASYIVAAVRPDGAGHTVLDLK